MHRADLSVELSKDKAVLTFANQRQNSNHRDQSKNYSSLKEIQDEAHQKLPDDHFIHAFTDTTVDAKKRFIVYDSNSNSAFLSMVHTAFANHYPLEIRPDDIHLLITQGIAHLFQHYPEDFRPIFVPFDNKQELQVLIPDIEDKSCWEAIPEGFANIVKSRIFKPEFADLLMQDYSNTTKIDHITKGITLMGAFSVYFSMSVGTMCFIPQFTLTGTVEDWDKIADMPKQIIQQLNLQDDDKHERKDGIALLHRWLTRLEPVLTRMSAARKGEVNSEFWSSFYKYHSESGGNTITGNMVYFFPFLKNIRNELQLNQYIMGPKVTMQGSTRYVVNGDEYEHGENGPGTTEFPVNFIGVDFNLELGPDQVYPMGMKGGMTAHTQDPSTNCVRSHFSISMFYRHNMPVKSARSQHQAELFVEKPVVEATAPAPAPAAVEAPVAAPAAPAVAAAPVAAASQSQEILFKMVVKKNHGAPANDKTAQNRNCL